MVRHKKRRCATSRLTCTQTRACRRPGRATAAQPRQVTSPWRDVPRWSAIDGQPPRAWMSMPLRGRMWYFDYVHYTGAARTCWALRWRQVWRVRRVGRCAGDATLCCVLSRLGVVSVGVLYACLYALCTRCPRVSCVQVEHILDSNTSALAPSVTVRDVPALTSCSRAARLHDPFLRSQTYIRSRYQYVSRRFNKL